MGAAESMLCRRFFAEKQRRDESGSRRDFPVVPSGAVCDEPFGDLHRVQCGTLADLIADAPEREAVGRGEVASDATHVHRVPTGSEQRHRIDLVARSVLQHDTRGRREGVACLFGRNRALRSTQMLSEWARITGTRTQVAETTMSECMILRVSWYIFISSLV